MKPSKQFNPWPGAIVGLGLFFLILTCWSVIQAKRGTSAVTDPSYYRHGLKFQETAVEHRTAESLGWQLQTSVIGRLVKMHLTNGNQQPVAGAAGEMSLLTEASGNCLLQLRETAEGRYQVRLPKALQGAVPAAVRFQRGGVLFDRRLQLNLAVDDK